MKRLQVVLASMLLMIGVSACLQATHKRSCSVKNTRNTSHAIAQFIRAKYCSSRAHKAVATAHVTRKRTTKRCTKKCSFAGRKKSMHASARSTKKQVKKCSSGVCKRAACSTRK